MYIEDISKLRAKLYPMFEDNEQMFNDILSVISAIPFGETFESYNGTDKWDLLKDYECLDAKEIEKALKEFYYTSISFYIEGIEWNTYNPDIDEYEDDPDLPFNIAIEGIHITTDMYRFLNELEDESIMYDWLSKEYGYNAECVNGYRADIK